MCLNSFATADTLTLTDEITGTEYTIETTKETSEHSTFYIEESQKLPTKTVMGNEGFVNLPTKYSGDYKYVYISLGTRNNGAIPYYILVYDGSNDGNAKYDRIMISKDKNFSNDRNKPFNETPEDKPITVNMQFTVSNKKKVTIQPSKKHRQIF